jgi:hypothetical protein
MDYRSDYPPRSRLQHFELESGTEPIDGIGWDFDVDLIGFDIDLGRNGLLW